MERKYSGNPGEAFFTGGGVHTFGNFSKLDDSRILTVQQALQNSTNLVFVRLMRDVVRYYMFQLPGSSAQLLADADDPRRAEYLSRFADREGKDFLARFWNKYRGKDWDEIETALMQGVRPAASKLAAVHRTIMPDASLAEFGKFIHTYLPDDARGRRGAHRQDVRPVRVGEHVAGRPRLRRLGAPARTVAGRLPAHPSEGGLGRGRKARR
jgi:membrane peptidoglycan carboxypeptidase